MQRSCCRSSDKTGAQPCASKQQSNVRCIVPSCCNPLSRPYNLKKRLCTLHMKVGAQQDRLSRCFPSPFSKMKIHLRAAAAAAARYAG